MIYRFETCALDVERRQFSFAGELRHLEPQVFDLLVCLIENRERVLSKDEILKALGGRRFVSDALIATRLGAARRAIGDTGDEQRLIKTFRRKGLRFVGSVVAHDLLSSHTNTSSLRLSQRVADLFNYAAITSIGLASNADLALRDRLVDEMENAIIIGFASLM